MNSMIKGYKVRFVKNGILYVEIPEKDMVIMVQNPYDYDVNSIEELAVVDGQYYVKGFEPKKKKTVAKKQEIVEEITE